MEHLHYITRKRARFEAICGRVNIPYGTPLEVRDGFLTLAPDKPLCAPDSENGEAFCCSDEDGRGRERGAYIDAILSKLQKRDDQWQARWDKIWNLPLCARYRRPDFKDYWLWDHSFYCAPVEHLAQIAALIGAVPAGR